MVKIWKEQITLLGVIDTGRLLHSPISIGMSADGKFSQVQLSQAFLEYGIWQDYGTGRETPRGNSGDIGREKKRQRRRWFSRKYYASVMNIKEFYEESIGSSSPAYLQLLWTERHSALRLPKLSFVICFRLPTFAISKPRNMIDVSILKQLITALQAESQKDAITPYSLGELLHSIADLLATAFTDGDYSDLREAIANEITARQDADTSLVNAINSETETRASADSSFNNILTKVLKTNPLGSNAPLLLGEVALPIVDVADIDNIPLRAM